MTEAVLMFLSMILQVFGAAFAFERSGVLAKLLGLFFCLLAIGCLAAGVVFTVDYAENKRKGNQK